MMIGHNRFGLFSKAPGSLSGPGPMGPRQLTLSPVGGFSGNGVATIGLDNTFSLLAHLPPPHTINPYAPAVYAAYLVDAKGKNGFYAGTLRPAGNGMYQVNFRSPVPLVHYDKVVVSLESPQAIGQAPQGPIVMKVKEGLLDSLGPVKKMGSEMWGRVKGFVGSRLGGKSEGSPEELPAGDGQPTSFQYQYTPAPPQGMAPHGPQPRGQYYPAQPQPQSPYYPTQPQPQNWYYSAQPQAQGRYYPAQPQQVQQPAQVQQHQQTQQPQQAPSPEVSTHSPTEVINHSSAEQAPGNLPQQPKEGSTLGQSE